MTADFATCPMSLATDREHPFDPPARLRELAGERSPQPLSFPDGHIGWLVTGYDTARAVMADTRFSARQELRHWPFRQPLAQEQSVPAPPGWFIHMDPPMHTRYRRLLTGQFTVRRMNRIAARIEEITEEHLDAMAAAGPCVDLVESFALPIPSLVICELLGVPYEQRAEFQDKTATALTLTVRRAKAVAAFHRLLAFFGRLVAAKRADPGDDLLSGLITTGELTDEELISIAGLLLIAGHETTGNMLALGAWALLRHPDQLAALQADPTLIDQAVEELVRYLSIVQFGAMRVALEDVDLAGVRIEAGQTVVLSIPAVNRDPARYTDPDALLLNRDSGSHLGFGHGPHQCLGQQLARMEMRIGYAALFRRFPDLQLAVPDEEVSLRTDMAIYGVHSLPVRL